MKNLMTTLLLCSVNMSALALLYMFLTPFLTKHYSAAGRYYTWLVIVVGLIIPFRPHFANPVVKVPMPSRVAAPVIRPGTGMQVTGPVPNVMPSGITTISWWQAVAVIWLAGVIVFLVYHGIKHYRFLKLTARWSRNVTDEGTLALVRELKTQMGITHDIGLELCGSIGSPMLIGIARPRILLPEMDLGDEELRFILKHELIHYKRKDIWYKFLVLVASAIHWFNPIVYLMAKVIDIQCELSCDGEVVRAEDADTRLFYSETIIGVIRYQSKLKTVLSTNFYGGKKGMKERIFSIMDMGKKKAGIAVICGVVVLTMGTGAVVVANAETKPPVEMTKDDTMIHAHLGVSFVPNPDIYGAYAGFGITISEDGTKLLYEGQPVRLFVDEAAESWAFYLDGAGSLNLSAVRNADGEIAGIEPISEQKAQEYQDTYFAEGISGNFAVNEPVQEQEYAKVQENVQEGESKFEQYEPFGITYSAADGALYTNGQRVKMLVDQDAAGGFTTFWTDENGTANLSVIRDTSGQITSVESISDGKAQEYKAALADMEEKVPDGLEERVEKRINERYSN